MEENRFTYHKLFDEWTKYLTRTARSSYNDTWCEFLKTQSDIVLIGYCRHVLSCRSSLDNDVSLELKSRDIPEELKLEVLLIIN